MVVRFLQFSTGSEKSCRDSHELIWLWGLTTSTPHHHHHLGHQARRAMILPPLLLNNDAYTTQYHTPERVCGQCKVLGHDHHCHIWPHQSLSNDGDGRRARSATNPGVLTIRRVSSSLLPSFYQLPYSISQPTPLMAPCKDQLVWVCKLFFISWPAGDDRRTAHRPKNWARPSECLIRWCWLFMATTSTKLASMKPHEKHVYTVIAILMVITTNKMVSLVRSIFLRCGNRAVCWFRWACDTTDAVEKPDH